ncbi:hypothetical protein [Halorussus halophilus]|uniref:hypothetical protein n=1 Tax=Halorussus halophilus TaxID=2650975 RepID=UPI001CE463E2|nr:hypothetical protein [Halorussus halophilus]
MVPNGDDSGRERRDEPLGTSGEEPSAGAPTEQSDLTLPDSLESQLDSLSESELHAVVTYARSRIPTRSAPEAVLEAGPGEEILEVIERNGSTEVVKKQPCAEGCSECPHGPYLYRVQLQPAVTLDDGPSLHWEFLGRVYDR